MVATLTKLRKGEDMREQLSKALLVGGADGVASATLAQDLGMSQRLTTYYLERMPGVAVRAVTKAPYMSRWFHAHHAADAQVYVDRCGSIKHKAAYFKADKVQAILTLLADRMELGATRAELAAASGLARKSTEKCVLMLRGQGRVKSARDWATTGNERRYFAVEATPKARPPKPPKVRKKDSDEVKAQRAIAKRERAETQKRLKKVDAALIVLKPSAKKPAPAPVKREVIVPANVKVTVLPGFTGDRFKPTEVPRFFSAMTPGSYLRTGSAIEQAYSAGDA